MDYEDNDAQDQNLHLGGEGSSKVSSVLHSYTLPKFDFDDNLQGQLRLDSLVESEVFLGITSQEDNQWIEEYPRGTSAMQFSSSAGELRHKDVWSEATSSESVEMLLKSVGQEEEAVEEILVEESDACGRTASLTNIMEPKVSDTSVVGSVEPTVSLPIGSCDIHQKPLVVSPSSECVKMQEIEDANTEPEVPDSSVGGSMEPTGSSPIGSCDMHENPLVASPSSGYVEIQEIENAKIEPEVPDASAGGSMEPTGSLPMGSCDIHENPFVVSPSSGCVKMQDTDDADTEPKVSDASKSNVCSLSSLSLVRGHSEEPENGVGSVTQQFTSGASMVSLGDDQFKKDEGSDINTVDITTPVASSSTEMAAQDISNKGVAAANDPPNLHTVGSNGDDGNLPFKSSSLVEVGVETRSTDKEVTFKERGDARLPLDSRGMGVDVVGAPHRESYVLPSSSGEGCEGVNLMAQESESYMVVLNNAVAAMESSKIPSSDVPDSVQLMFGTAATADIIFTDSQPRSPILGVSLLHDDGEKVEVRFSREGSSQKGALDDSTIDCALDGPLPVVKNDAVSDGAEKVVHMLDGLCDPLVGNRNTSPVEGGLESSKTLEMNTLNCDPSAEEGSNGSGSMLLDAKESMTGEDQVESLNLTGMKTIEPSHKDDRSKGSMHENAPFSNDREGLDIVSNTSAIKEEKGFTFAVSASAGSGNTSVEGLGLSKNVTVPYVNLSGDILDLNKSREDSLASPQTPSSAAIAGVKGNSACKPRRKSVGKETTKKGGAMKETTPPIRSGRVEKAPVSLTFPVSTECSNPKHKGTLSVPLPNLPNLNNPTSIFQQSFTDDQQLQLRAQILVYGSLISGMPPEELHMIAAFGQSDGGRRAWEAAWFASLERIRGHKSLASNPGTPMQSRPDVGNRDPDQGIKIGSAQGKVVSTPITGASHVCISSPVVPSMIPISSPLWNIPTPYESNAMPKSPLLDYRQTLSPLHLYQTPQGQNLGVLNQPLRLQEHFTRLWFASSPNVASGAQFSALPITEAVRLTTVKESGAPGISVIPVDLSAGPSVSPGPSSLSNVRKEAVSSSQPSSDSRSRKRKKVAASVVVSQMPVSSQAEVPSPSSPVPHLPWAANKEGHDQISFLSQIQTNSGMSIAVSSHPPTSTDSIIPIPTTSKSNPANSLSAISPASTHGHPLLGNQNLEKTVTIEEIASKIEESKLQAADAAVHAASAVSHCQAVWNQLEMQKISDDEANIVSSAASIAAAACIAKVAVAAAKIASNVAEQARSMANEVFQSRTASYDQSSMVSRANVIPNFDKATPASILKSADGGDHSTSIISAAREAARRRIKAASAASKHAENLDAILKAAELAAEAVSQTRKIVAMGNPTPLMELIEAGPKGYRKTNRSFNQQCDSDKQNVEAVSNDKEIHILEHGLSPQENSRDLSKNKMMINNDMPGSVTNRGNDKSAALAPKNSESSKPIGVIPAPEFGSIHTSDVSQDMPQSTSDTRKENNIKEGCLVEVCKDDNMNKRAWFAAKILTLKDEKAFVCYNEIQSDEGHLKEWIPLEVEGVDSPRIRLAHPISTKQSEGTRKRGRKAMIDYDWCSGDRVDVWVQDSWCEATVLEANKTDLTSLTVQFHGDEEKSVVRLWHVRPSLIWKDGEWIEWSNVKGIRSSEGDTPHEKRRKFGSHDAEGTEKVASSDIDLNAQKERSGVVFGVPSPGKKQKFMDVTKHYVANGYVKKNKPSDSGKLPRAQGHRELKNNSKNDVKEKQVAEIKPKLHKPRKPPIPRIDGNPPGHQNRTSNKEDAITAPCSSSDGPERLNKRKFTPGGGKPPKVEVKNKSSTSEAEPRRSNRKIQPTSRLLEGLQSSLTMTKIPSFSSQRSHNNVTSKGTGSGR